MDQGGIAGQAISSSTISSCASSGTFAINGKTAGGVVGYLSDSTVSSCLCSSTLDGSNYVGGIVGSSSGGTITGSTYSGTVKGWEYLGGIAGNTNGSLSGNSMQGDIYVYRTDDDNGKVNKTIRDFGFNYTLSNGGDGNVSYSTGSPVEYGRLDISSYRSSKHINFIYGNSDDEDGNTVSGTSKITVQDNYVRYSLSISTGKDDYWDWGVNYLKVYGTFTVSATRYEEQYFEHQDTESTDGPSKGTTSGSDEESYTCSGFLSIGAGWDKSVNGFIDDMGSTSDTDNFTGSW